MTDRQTTSVNADHACYRWNTFSCTSVGVFPSLDVKIWHYALFYAVRATDRSDYPKGGGYQVFALSLGTLIPYHMFDYMSILSLKFSVFFFQWELSVTHSYKGILNSTYSAL